VIQDSVAGKKDPPEPNPKEEPGLGPEIAPKKTSHRPSSGEPKARTNRHPLHGSPTLFGVIPTLGIGGPLAILALIFPSVFGGVLVLFRRWLAFLTVISVVCLALLLQTVFYQWLRGTWWASDNSLWYILMGATFLGALWAWGRYLGLASDPATPSPGRAESIVLCIMSLSCLAIVALYYFFTDLSARDVGWSLLVTFSLGIWLATLYKTYRSFVEHRATAARPSFPDDRVSAVPYQASGEDRRLAPGLSIEGLMLWGAMIGFIFFAIQRGTGADTGGQAIAGESKPGDGVLHPAEFVGEVWQFTAPEDGAFVSTSVLHGDYVLIAARNAVGDGKIYCLSKQPKKTEAKKDSPITQALRRTPELVAEFDDGSIKQPYSSPCIADNRLYIGEGFHNDKNCKLYCIDLKNLANADPKKRTLEKAWTFQTPGQVESSPAVANGKVYFGAGNNAFHCIDAVMKDKEHWRFPPKDYNGRLLRFCGGPTVAGKRVFIGTGVDRDQPDDPGERALFCLDADSDKQIWKVPVDLPSWAAPIVVGPHVYFALGNGDILYDADHPAHKPLAKPAGAVLCLDVEKGEQLWRFDVPNGVLEKPAVDQHQIYFGSRDGYIYCIGRKTGQLRWKTFMHSPVVASPAIAKCSDCDATAAVYALSTAGRLCCLDPATGKELWTFTLELHGAFMMSSPRVEVLPSPEGDHRRIYFAGAIGPGAPLLSGQAVVYCVEDRVKER
jgi:outer membrane protein assembly factor BamB